MNKCQKCHNSYDWKTSKSSVKMTYCSTVCEVLALGFHLSSLERGLYKTWDRKPAVKVEQEVVKPDLPPPRDRGDDELRDLVPA